MKKTIVAAIGLTLLALFAAIAQTPAGPKHHVVFQMTAPKGDEWKTLIAHVTNMRAAFEKDGGSEVEVVFFGPGLSMLLKTNTEQEEALRKLSDAGVTLSACQNAMKFMKVTTEDLFPFANQVDSGVAQLVRRQEQGWAYIQ